MNEAENMDINGTAPSRQEERTFTQAELNAIVADRLARERAKYADYDKLKDKAGKADALQQQLDTLEADTARRAMKKKVSDATGVPEALLTGDTEESCTEQAHEIMQFAAPSYPAMAYLCRPCNAYVGVHSGTDRPKGSLANAELRGWRKATHARFDPLWRDGPFKKRNAAYRWLSEQMKLPIEQTHIGMFTVEQCKAALEIINKGVTV